ncbi:MAG: NYN domain-containing protein [Patescibacteria group bacterium]
MTILFIDGRNFISKINSIFNSEKEINFSSYNFSGLFDKVLSDIKVDRKIFYIGKIIKHKETAEKSEKLIQKQRRLKNNLEKQGFEVVYGGRVRGFEERCPAGHKFLSFREKGVDVRIAVDMITFAENDELKTAIICSSDSDLQPAIMELKNKKIERIYLGFENMPNKGLTFTTNRTILIRNSEVVEFLPKTLI